MSKARELSELAGAVSSDGTNVDVGTTLKVSETTGAVKIGSTNSAGSHNKLILGQGNTQNNANLVINTNDQNVNAITISNWDGATATNGARIGFDNSGHGGWSIGNQPNANTFYIGEDYTNPELLVEANGSVSSSGHMFSRGGAAYVGGTSLIYSSGATALNTSPKDIYYANQGTIDTGVYLLQVYVTGGGWYTEYWTGVMQWANYGTNSSQATGIYMTGMGHAPNGRELYARVQRRASNQMNQSIQVWSSSSDTVYMTVHVKRLM